MIQAVLILKGGAVSEVYMADDNDDIYILDMDVLAIGECPLCHDGLQFECCKHCGINWNNVDDGTDIANDILVHKTNEFMKNVAKNITTEAQDEQFLLG